MRTAAATIALIALALSPWVFAQEGEGDEGNEIKKLKKILAKMEYVEELLAKSKLAEGSAEQAEILKALQQKVKEGKMAQEDVVAEIDKQLAVVLKKMKGIDEDIEKLIAEVKMSQSSGSGGMEMQQKKDKGGDGKPQSGEKRKEEEDGKLKEMRPEDQEKNGQQNKDGSGQDKKPGEGGKDPADKPYNAEGGRPDGSSPRAEGVGRWGSLPMKQFMEALASGKVKVPEKYESLIRKYMEMLAKKAAEEKK